MDGARRRVTSLPALAGAIGGLAVDALYLNLISRQGVPAPEGRVAFVALWVAAAAVLAGVGVFTELPARRAWLLGWSAAALFVLSLPAAFSIGIPLLLCGALVAGGAFAAGRSLRLPWWGLALWPLPMLAGAAGVLALGFAMTAN